MLTDIGLLLMVGKGIRAGIYHAIHRYAAANNKYNKDKESSYLIYLDINNLYVRTMSQKIAVNNFKWKKNMWKFKEKFIKNYDEDTDKG